MLDYELLDFGNSRKLERFGPVVTDRPEVLAVGPAAKPPPYWADRAHLRFEEGKGGRGNWQHSAHAPHEWRCHYGGRNAWTLRCKVGPYKHVGVFPEQAHHWAFLSGALSEGDRYLNLFAYTGAASLAAAVAGADVHHVEASRSVVNWAAQNAEESNIQHIRWVCDDALKYANREIRRGRKFKGISMDPPVFGRSAKGQLWRLEEQFEGLIERASALLEKGGFLFVNTYSPVLGLEEMVKSCEKNGLRHNDSGWLSVDTKDGRTLQLSKYVAAELK